MSDERAAQTKKLFCNTCNGVTNHILAGKHVASDEETDDIDPRGRSETFEVWTDLLWVCAGCSRATLEHESRIGGLGLEEDDERLPPDVTYYPKRSFSSAGPKNFLKLGPKLTTLYREVLTTFNENCLILCSVGLRTLLEAICEDKGISGRKLEHQIDGLIAFLPSQNLIDALHGFRFTGNEAAHELGALTHDQAKDAILVMEDLLNFLYDFDYKASRIKNASKRSSLRRIADRGSVQ